MKYSDITNSKLAKHLGKELKDIYNLRCAFHQIEFLSIKDNKFDKMIYRPLEELADEKTYIVYEYSRISGSDVEYSKICIFNL